MEDIALRDAQVIWDYGGKEPDAPAILVVGDGIRDVSAYVCSWGSCNMEFDEADDEGKLAQLFRQFHQLVLLYNLDPRKVSDAFVVIPEYRQALLERGEGHILPPEYRQ